ncbi:unnamed protein product [Aphanomyces euteiches]
MAACSKTNEPVSTTTPTGEATAAAPATTDAAPTVEDADKGLKPEEGAKLVVWDAADTRPFHEAIIKEFTAKYGIEVKMEEVPPPDQAAKFATDGPAGIAADVGVIPHDNISKVVSAGLWLPNDVFTEETKGENSELAVQGATFNNVLYGYPKSTETYALFYNKDLIKTAPKSFDEIIEFAKTYNDPAKNKFAYMMKTDDFYYNYPFLATTGGYIFGKNGTDGADVGLNNEGAIKGATIYQNLQKTILPLKSTDVTDDIKKGLFISGTLAMDLNGPWAIADYKAAGINLGVAPIPSIDGKPAVSLAGIKILGVNAFTKFPNTAKLYAHFATSQASQMTNFKLTGVLPANKVVADDPSVKADEFTASFLKQLENAQPMPSITEMNAIWGPMNAAFADIWNGGKDPKVILDNAVKQIKEANAAVAK